MNTIFEYINSFILICMDIITSLILIFHISIPKKTFANDDANSDRLVQKFMSSTFSTRYSIWLNCILIALFKLLLCWMFWKEVWLEICEHDSYTDTSNCLNISILKKGKSLLRILVYILVDTFCNKVYKYGVRRKCVSCYIKTWRCQCHRVLKTYFCHVVNDLQLQQNVDFPLSYITYVLMYNSHFVLV